MKRRILSFFICLILINVSFFASNHVKAVKASETIISAENAKKLAIAQVNSDKLSNKESFKDNIHISKMDSLFDLDGIISAYLFQFEDPDKTPSGYMIVGASRDHLPIIEYAYEGSCFLERAKQFIVKNEYLTESSINYYYTGGLDYYIGKNKDSYIYRVSANGIDKIKRSEINSSEIAEFNNSGKDEVNLMWNNLENNVKENNINNNLNDNIVFKEGKYKSAYTAVNSLTVKDNASVSYTTIYDQKMVYTQLSGAVCGFNLLKYWNKQDSKYYRLIQNLNYVFYDLYDDMCIAENTTTYPEDYRNVMEEYFKDHADGYSSSAYYSFNVSWDRITDEINSNYPVSVIFKGNDLIISQYVLGVGYKEYTNGTNNYRYILIADGLENKATRYVNYYTEYKTGGGVGAIRLRPY
ncbi:hypothetical protein Ana3638_14385 [Anaerocolumna sedimenticola]|uniref:Peptidase C39-like domain-containing protein n=1 Tax=Anaerocolumna sedimenticola TaxID=2696063 RepID=A0A6P1TPU4_9FIRM|nr:hypothetical protein [Anaerocolumna sedimenticola]QHQ61816.1 hypothetical protein Ana3638_14385 [Anaerocolumna sedimenticola]